MSIVLNQTLLFPFSFECTPLQFVHSDLILQTTCSHRKECNRESLPQHTLLFTCTFCIWISCTGFSEGFLNIHSAFWYDWSVNRSTEGDCGVSQTVWGKNKSVSYSQENEHSSRETVNVCKVAPNFQFYLHKPLTIYYSDTEHLLCEPLSSNFKGKRKTKIRTRATAVLDLDCGL